jgi:hypothetical protein
MYLWPGSFPHSLSSVTPPRHPSSVLNLLVINSYKVVWSPFYYVLGMNLEEIRRHLKITQLRNYLYPKCLYNNCLLLVVSYLAAFISFVARIWRIQCSINRISSAKVCRYKKKNHDIFLMNGILDLENLNFCTGTRKLYSSSHKLQSQLQVSYVKEESTGLYVDRKS